MAVRRTDETPAESTAPPAVAGTVGPADDDGPADEQRPGVELPTVAPAPAAAPAGLRVVEGDVGHVAFEVAPLPGWRGYAVLAAVGSGALLAYHDGRRRPAWRPAPRAGAD